MPRLASTSVNETKLGGTTAGNDAVEPSAPSSSDVPTAPPRPKFGKALLRESEALAYLSVSRATLWRLVDRGELKKTKLPGGGVRYALRELERFVDRNTR